MKINPVAIQSYQQITRRDTQPAARQQAEAEQVQADLTINPQAQAASSDVAVKAPTGSYAEYLTDAERSALDLIFSRFADSNRFGTAYNRDAAEEPAPRTLGKVIDLKV